MNADCKNFTVFAFTVITADELTFEPSLDLAVIFAVPLPIAVTLPLAETLATFSLSDVQVTDGLLAFHGETVVVKFRVFPTSNVAFVLFKLIAWTLIIDGVGVAFGVVLGVTGVIVGVTGVVLGVTGVVLGA